MTEPGLSRVVYDSPLLQAVHRPGSGDALLITFSPFGLRPDGQDFWGRSFVEKKDLPALGFVAKADNWFPAADMRAAAAHLAGLLGGYRARTTYGGSMGAYGALKHAALLGAEVGIACGPQFSIDPRQIKSINFNRYFDPALHQDMAITAADLPGRSYVIFDSAYDFDLENADAIARLSPTVHLVRVPHVGHECVKLFAGTQRVTTLIEACRVGDLAAVRAHARKARAESPLRVLGVAGRLCARSPDIARALFARNESRFDRKQIGAFYHQLSYEYLRRQQLGLAEEAAQKAVAMVPSKLSFLRRMVALKEAQGDQEGAMHWCQRALALDPRDAHSHFKLSGLYMHRRQWEEAERAVARALEIVPSEVTFLLRMAKLRVEQGDLDQASEWYRKALAWSPRDASIHYVLARLREAAGDLPGAVASLRNAIALDPAHENYPKELRKLERLAAAA